MAFGSSTTSSFSSSTLSPLAPPFTIDRPFLKPAAAPYDYLPPDPPQQYTGPVELDQAWPRHGGPVRRALSSNLVQAEPFYPQYVSGISQGGGLDANCYEESSDLKRVGRGMWNSHSDEDGGWTKGAAGGDGMGSSAPSVDIAGDSVGASKWRVEGKENGALGNNQSWTEPSGKGCPLNGAATIKPSNVASDNHVHRESMWSDGPFESFEQQSHLVLGTSGWLGDEPSGHFQGGCRPPSKMYSTSGPHHYQLASASLSSLSGSVTSSEACANIDPASSLYNSSIEQAGLGRTKQLGYYPGIAYLPQSQVCSPATLNISAPVEKSKLNNINPCFQPAVSYKNSDKQMYRSPIKVTKPVISPNVVAKEGHSNNGQERMDMSRADAESLFVENENSVFVSEDMRNLSENCSKVKASCLNSHQSAEPGVCNQNSSDALEKLSLAVDSPCWKGVSSSQYSPFHWNASIPYQQLQEDVCVKETTTSTVTNENEDHFLDSLNEKNDVSLSSDYKSMSHTRKNGVASTGTIGKYTSSTTQPGSNLGMPIPTVSTQSTPSNLNTLAKENTFHSVFSWPCQSDRVVKDLDECDLMESEQAMGDVHFLTRSLHDISTYLCNYCDRVDALKEHDRELLSSAVNKLNACLSEKASQVETRFRSQSLKPKNYFSPFGNKDKQKVDASMEIMDLFEPRTDYDKSCLNRDLDFKRSSEMTKEFENGLKEFFLAKEDSSESSDVDLYKKLWIKAEVALCSAKHELQLSRINTFSRKCGEEVTTDVGCLSDYERMPAREVNPTTINLPRNLTNASLPKTGENLSKNNNILGPDVSHGSCEKPQVVSNFNSEDNDVDPSVMARLKVIKGRVDKSDSQTAQHQCTRGDPVAAGALKEPFLGTSLLDKGFSEANIQLAHVVTNSERNPWLFYPRELQDRGLTADKGPNERHFGTSYDKGCPDARYLESIYSEAIGLYADNHQGHVENNLDFEARPIINPYLPSESYVRRLFPGKDDASSSDWEHVLKEELTL